jgi:hypothetical protein
LALQALPVYKVTKERRRDMSARASLTYVYMVVFLIVYFVPFDSALPGILRDGYKTYLVDRTGERWDITQAKSIGFIPNRFENGLGRYAFTPLDDSYLTDNTDWIYDRLRVIGVANGSEAKAYSISRLRRHEIVNSTIGSEPIAVGY